MIELFGIQLGTFFQGGTLAALLALLAIVGRAWIVGIPERLRVANEGKTNAATELAERFHSWRKEVHDFKNELAVLKAKQHECEKGLADERAEKRFYKDKVSNMLFLIRLLISELKRLDPKSIIVAQAEATMEQMGHSSPDLTKSAPLAAAEHTVEVAKDAVQEVKNAENGK